MIADAASSIEEFVRCKWISHLCEFFGYLTVLNNLIKYYHKQNISKLIGAFMVI